MCKQKIYIISWNGTKSFGGVERVTQNMLLCWKEQYDVEIIDFDRMKQKSIYKLLLGKHYVLDAVLVSIYTKHEIKKNKSYDIKTVVQGYNAPFVRADLMRAPGTMRGYKMALGGGKCKWHLNQLFEKISAQSAKRVIAVGDHVKRELSELYKIDEKKIAVIENCVDTDFFCPDHKQHSENVIKILFAGRLEYGKGLNKLVELANKIEPMNDIRLLIAANNADNTELFDGLQHTEISIGLNKREMNQFYNSGDVMFFPSLYEGFSLSVIEALSVGVPVLGEQNVINDLRGQIPDGIGIIKKSMDENIFLMVQLAKKYQDLQKREALHQNVTEKYRLEIYREKLEKLWDES